jgi:hypothetical protein
MNPRCRSARAARVLGGPVIASGYVCSDVTPVGFRWPTASTMAVAKADHDGARGSPRCGAIVGLETVASSVARAPAPLPMPGRGHRQLHSPDLYREMLRRRS